MKALKYLLMGMILLILPGCQKDYQEKVPDEIGEILGLKIDRPLEVSLATPQGDTTGPSDYQSINVVFNQPMKALSAKEAKIAVPFKIEPAVKGKFRWKGTATVAFEPEKPLPYGTQFKVTVPAGLASPGGNKLKEDYNFEFTTPGPQVVKTFPKSGHRGQKDGDKIIFQFDQSVDPTSVTPHLSYTAPQGSPSPKARAVTEEELKILNADRSKENLLPVSRLIAVDTTGLKPEVSYTLKLDKGVTGQGGPVASTREELITFTSLGPLKWEGGQPKERLRPESDIYFRFNNKVNAKVLKEHVLLQPPVEITASEYDDENAWSTHSLYLPLEPNTDYKVTISGELTDIHGQKLGQDVTFDWKTKDRSPMVNIPEGIAVLEAQDTLTIPMGLRNIDSMTYRMVALNREQVMSMLAEQKRNWLWGTQAYTPITPFTVNKTVKPNGPRNQVYTKKLDLREALKSKKFGFVYYQVECKSGESTYHRRGLAQVTNLGATGKFSPENSLFFASSLDQAVPQEGVEATVLDHRGRPLWRGTSNEKGLIEAPGWSDLTSKSESDDYAPQLYLLLKQGQDEVYIENGGFGSVYSWQFDIPVRWSSSEHYLTSKVYSERGLYRPGEQVHLKGSLRDREKGEWSLPQLSEISFEVKDSRDQKIRDGKIALSEFGTFHHTVQLDENAPTGSYRVDYSLDESLAKEWDVSKRVAGATFRVEEFEAAQFQVDVKSEAKAYVMGDEASFTVDAKWLFGTPMQQAELKWSARVEPAVYSSEDYPGYRFGPTYGADDDRDDTKTVAEESAKTDARGQFKGKVMLQGLPYKGDADLVLEGTITSANRRSITGSHLVPLSRGEFRIGLKPSSTFVPAGDPVDIQMVTLTPEGQPVGGKEIKVELVQREWNSVRKSDVDGRFRWITEVEDKVVSSSNHTSTKDVSTFKVKPEGPGYYIVRLSATDGKKNQILSESSFYAHGSGLVGWAREEGDAIELVPDKLKYAPGETAKILIKSPFPEATALVTYERDLILHSYTTKLKGSAPVIEVPLTEEHLPNLYVSVMLFRGRVTPEVEDPQEDIGKPSFKIGYVGLPVSPDSKRLKVEINTDQDRYGPKDEVVTKIKVTDSKGNPVRAELSVAAADVGVLNLINYKTPDLFNTYYGQLPLAVKTAESRTDVIGQRSYGTKGEDEGGGGGYNSGFRKDFKSTAVWEPQVVTDKDGLAEVRFELPENLTTFRIMATAITGDTRCGSADREIITTKPLILKPSRPAFARIGDDFQVGVLAVNGTEKGATVKVKVTSEGIQAGEEEPKEVYLRAGEEREILFSYKAESEGAAKFQFSGEMAGETDGLEFELPLQLATQKTNLAQTGHFDDGQLEQPLEVPATAVKESAKLEVRLSSSILVGVDQGIQSLLEYPYGCLEQRLSRVTPLLLADHLVQSLEISGWNGARVKARVQKSLDELANYSHRNGGLKIWPDSRYVHPFLTARAVSTAHLAKQQGYEIKGVWLDKARGYLKSYLDGSAKESWPLSDTETLVCKAAALEALTKYGFSGKGYLNTLMDKRSKMPAVGKAYLLKAAYRLDEKKSASLLAQELSNSVKLENATAYFDVDNSTLPWLFSSEVRDTGLILEALLSTENDFPVADKVVIWLLEARNKSGSWGTTANNAAALSGLVAYSDRFEGTDPSFEVSAKLGDKLLGEKKLDKKTNQVSLQQNLQVPSKETLKLEKSGDGRLYYNLAVSYEDTAPSPPKDEGLTVLRSITDLDGNPVGALKGGKLYKIKLSVVAPSLRRYVVLKDPVPAGLSVVKTDFATESKALEELLSRGNQPSWQTFHRFEDYADRILLFADALAPGEHTYEYLVRAQTPGTYLQPAAQAEEMYHPEVFGRTSVRTIEVK